MRLNYPLMYEYREDLIITRIRESDALEWEKANWSTNLFMVMQCDIAWADTPHPYLTPWWRYK